MIRKSISASILIGLGSMSLYSTNNWIGPILFAFGLLCVCKFNANLYTGKAGYLIRKSISASLLIQILLINLLSGYVFGLFLSICNPSIINIAIDKVQSWSASGYTHLFQSIGCGIVMFIAVDLYKRGTILGIIFGVPIFIFCGFQHCIANIITCGIARTFSPYIFVSIVGNLFGANFISILLNNSSSNES